MNEGFPVDGVIYHIAALERWQSALQRGEYRPESLAIEGFIHCSLQRQVLPVADAYYRGQTGLVLLEIDSHAINDEIRYEGVGDRFPHIYGPLNVSAVIRVASFPSQAHGGFAFPPEFA
jgi:uncharacterized protein (DUF952 family)